MDWQPRVGMRVVCVDASCREGFVWADGEELHHGRVYEIYRIFLDLDRVLVIEFVGARRSKEACDDWGGPLGYNPSRFRPLDERRLDIFRSILTQAPTEKEPA